MSPNIEKNEQIGLEPNQRIILVRSESISSVQSESISSVQSELISSVQSEPISLVESEPISSVQTEPIDLALREPISPDAYFFDFQRWGSVRDKNHYKRQPSASLNNLLNLPYPARREILKHLSVSDRCNLSLINNKECKTLAAEIPLHFDKLTINIARCTICYKMPKDPNHDPRALHIYSETYDQEMTTRLITITNTTFDEELPENEKSFKRKTQEHTHYYHGSYPKFLRDQVMMFLGTKNVTTDFLRFIKRDKEEDPQFLFDAMPDKFSCKELLIHTNDFDFMKKILDRAPEWIEGLYLVADHEYSGNITYLPIEIMSTPQFSNAAYHQVTGFGNNLEILSFVTEHCAVSEDIGITPCREDKEFIETDERLGEDGDWMEEIEEYNGNVLYEKDLYLQRPACIYNVWT